ncbi:MAG TPA: beta-ketoacyl-[acyl-carrier-protein] synthase II [Planctomycetes bacterium]|nr:beta-ketoacyl-[acyl-carrier-protein] synthase II [Planctomycetota bacterium]
MTKRRVVVTGIGLVTPLGNSREETFQALLSGENGICTITHFDPSEFACRIAGEVKDLDTVSLLGARESRRMDPHCQYGVAAAIEAMEDAHLGEGGDLRVFDPKRVACILGTGIGGILEVEQQRIRLSEKGPRWVSPMLVPKMMFNAVTGQIALRYGLKGPNFAIGSACASSSHAIGTAMRTIQYGDADLVVTGGAEAAVTPLGIAGFASMKALSTRNDDPGRASRPFDRERNGFVMGEGAGVLILEEYEHAKKRGVKIYAEVLGFGASDDAFHLTAPDETGSGPAQAVQMALKDGGVAPEQIDYVNAHGTSTKLNDRMETKVLKVVFGEAAKEIPVSSTKSMIGHLLGASGSVEFAVTCLSVSRGILHPTRNYENPDPECDLDYIPGEARKKEIQYGISNSFGFGGTNCCLLAGKI